MKYSYLIALLLCGCVSAKNSVAHVTTYGVRTAVASAACSTRNAENQTVRAKASLQVAKAKSRELLTVASPAERPLALELESALTETQTSLDGVQKQLKAAEEALADTSTQAEALQNQISAEETELSQSREAATRMQAGRDFWRAAAWKLALLALALGAWSFRKPLLALAGL